MPSISPGSSQRVTRLRCTPQVSCPSGAAGAGVGPSRATATRAHSARRRAIGPSVLGWLMRAVLPGGRLRDYPRTTGLVNDSGRQTLGRGPRRILVAREPAVPAPVRLLDVLEDDVDLVGGGLADLHHRLRDGGRELPLLVLGASRVPLDRCVGHDARLLT